MYSLEVIKVKNLNKSFTTRQTFPGIFATLKGLFFAKTVEVPAVSNLSFCVKKGERIAFIGPNGAGKSTTIKMLTGILHPSSGELRVLGMIPCEERKALGYKIGTVFGQRTQLWYHLPPSDTFALLAKIYEIPNDVYEKRLRNLSELFELSSFLDKPVSKLSLGQRMRCEIVASLLHNPDIVFLDEPTIGLDINAKLKIRKLLQTLSEESGTTLFLTSHDMADIEQVCDRVIVLNEGTILLDGSVKELKKSYIRKKRLILTTEKETLSLNIPGVTVLASEEYRSVYEVDMQISSIDKVISEVLEKTTVKDLTIEDPSMEEIIRAVYDTANHAS